MRTVAVQSEPAAGCSFLDNCSQYKGVSGASIQNLIYVTHIQPNHFARQTSSTVL